MQPRFNERYPNYAFAAWVILTSTNLGFAEGNESLADSEIPSQNTSSKLNHMDWNHGSADCSLDEDPAIEVFEHDNSSYILRQNKCLSYEAPFIYVLMGKEKVLVLDTGAGERFPLYETVRMLLEERSSEVNSSLKEILVIHSHSHRDHYSGDSLFVGKPNVTIVEPNYKSVIHHFQFENWPEDMARIQLGGREIIIIATPGHQEEAISVYDIQNQWLLTGDTFYPGYIYVKDWRDYKQSIARLLKFSESHQISALLGSHIEMTRESGQYYPIGATYQPNEAPLTLTLENLRFLSDELEKTDKPRKIEGSKFIVVPMNTFQRALSNAARWFTQ